jgi:hypothetical protein
MKNKGAGGLVGLTSGDALTCALGDAEHHGRTRTTPGSKPWKIGFPVERQKYPDRSRQRRKEREADRMAKIE